MKIMKLQLKLTILIIKSIFFIKILYLKIIEESIYYIPINKNESILNGKKFFELCMNKVLINNETLIKKENPLISVVIPIYNVNDNLWCSLRSIQNQNISNLEIILVNDASNNETYKALKKSQDEDPRISLIFI